jgi:hypothetical protein
MRSESIPTIFLTLVLANAHQQHHRGQPEEHPRALQLPQALQPDKASERRQSDDVPSERSWLVNQSINQPSERSETHAVADAASELEVAGSSEQGHSKEDEMQAKNTRFAEGQVATTHLGKDAAHGHAKEDELPVNFTSFTSFAEKKLATKDTGEEAAKAKPKKSIVRDHTVPALMEQEDQDDNATEQGDDSEVKRGGKGKGKAKGGKKNMSSFAAFACLLLLNLF